MTDHVANTDQLSLEIIGDGPNHTDPGDERAARVRAIARLRLLWNRRPTILRVTGAALVLSTLIVFLIPSCPG